MKDYILWIVAALTIFNVCYPYIKAIIYKNKDIEEMDKKINNAISRHRDACKVHSDNIKDGGMGAIMTALEPFRALISEAKEISSNNKVAIQQMKEAVLEIKEDLKGYREENKEIRRENQEIREKIILHLGEHKGLE